MIAIPRRAPWSSIGGLFLLRPSPSRPGTEQAGPARNPCSLGNSAPKRGPLWSTPRPDGSDNRSRSIQMKRAMTSQPSKTPVQAELSDSDLNTVVGGQRTFQFTEQNGNTYAVGLVLGQTVKVKLT